MVNKGLMSTDEISENISNVLKLYRCLRKTANNDPR